MKAIRVTQAGEPEVLRLEETPEPRPQNDQVLVRVRAIGVNPVDTYIRAGRYPLMPAFPYTPGTDAAGIVAAIGGNVRGVAVGDRVYVAGTVTLCRESQVHPLSASISFEQGAAVGVPYATAYRALFQKACVLAGDTVLVHGASGGVGIAAVQLGRAASHVAARGQRTAALLAHHRPGHLE